MQFLQEKERDSGITPAALQSKPKLLPAAEEYHSAFMILQSSRGYGFDGNPLPILLSEIESFCNLLGYDTLEARQYVLSYTRICDKAFLNMVRKNARNSSQSGSRQPPGSSGR